MAGAVVTGTPCSSAWTRSGSSKPLLLVVRDLHMPDCRPSGARCTNVAYQEYLHGSKRLVTCICRQEERRRVMQERQQRMMDALNQRRSGMGWQAYLLPAAGLGLLTLMLGVPGVHCYTLNPSRLPYAPLPSCRAPEQNSSTIWTHQGHP